jgi:hypothetical protein
MDQSQSFGKNQLSFSVAVIVLKEAEPNGGDCILYVLNVECQSEAAFLRLPPSALWSPPQREAAQLPRRSPECDCGKEPCWTPAVGRKGGGSPSRKPEMGVGCQGSGMRVHLGYQEEQEACLSLQWDRAHGPACTLASLTPL